MPTSTITIGSDYIESKGSRIESEIFIRESNGKEYLIIKVDNKEGAFEIVDKNTLQQDMGIMKIQFKRV